ncbi:hypothetical protein J5224_31930, partial [Candidatus Symbiopectobacterium sp. NZEC135]|nr:hypothetical protein [Candidatus Symbiopectobacterium sp. NZEC135]
MSTPIRETHHVNERKYFMKNMTLALGLLISSFAATAVDLSKGADNFYKSDKVTQQKVTFKNQYQMNV